MLETQKDQKDTELEEKMRKMEEQAGTTLVAPAAPVIAPSPAATGEMNYGAIGLLIEFVGIFIFGIPCSIIGIILGLAGANTRTKKDAGYVAICAGFLEIIITIAALGVLMR